MRDASDILTEEEKEKVKEEYRKEILRYLETSRPNWIDAYHHIAEDKKHITAHWYKYMCGCDIKIKCSRCGWSEKFIGKYSKFCPCCDAEMINEGELNDKS